MLASAPCEPFQQHSQKPGTLYHRPAVSTALSAQCALEPSAALSALLSNRHCASCHQSACCFLQFDLKAGHSNAPEARAQPVSKAACASWSALFLAMFSSTRCFSSACSLGLYPTAKRPSSQANRPASTRLCSSTWRYPQCISADGPRFCSTDQLVVHHALLPFKLHRIQVPAGVLQSTVS